MEFMAKVKLISAVFTDAKRWAPFNWSKHWVQNYKWLRKRFRWKILLIEASTGDILYLTYKEWKTQSLTIGVSNSINISCKKMPSQWRKVVVTAFGNKKRERALGSSTEIKVMILLKWQQINPINAMQGKDCKGCKLAQTSEEHWRYPPPPE